VVEGSRQVSVYPSSFKLQGYSTASKDCVNDRHPSSTAEVKLCVARRENRLIVTREPRV
jgi:hypothetical protein